MDIIYDSMTEREECCYYEGYNNIYDYDKVFQEHNAPTTILEYMYYRLGKLDGFINHLEMGDNSMLYNTDVYSTEHNWIEQLIKEFK